MVLHSWRCCACLTAWWYSSPVHLVMFVVHFVLGLPRPLEPFTLPSKVKEKEEREKKKEKKKEKSHTGSN